MTEDIKRLVEALGPLARATDEVHVWNGKSHDIVTPPDDKSAAVFNITYGDIRRARSALAPFTKETDHG